MQIHPNMDVLSCLEQQYCNHVIAYHLLYIMKAQTCITLGVIAQY